MKRQYLNREISWLSFNDRVLQEAMDESNPLIERMRFLGIFSNNLDEFFRVRVATLKRLSALNKKELKPLSYNPDATLNEIYAKVITLNKKFITVLRGLKQELKEAGVHWIDESGIATDQEGFIAKYFTTQLRPFLVPIILGEQGFPALNDEVVYLAVAILEENEAKHYAIIEIPEQLNRLVVLPTKGKEDTVIFIDDIIRYNLKNIFPIYDIKEITANAFKITRDSELDLDEDVTTSMFEKITKSLEGRKKGKYVRFVYDQAMPEDLSTFLIKSLKVKKDAIYPSEEKYHNKKDLMAFPSLNQKHLVFRKYKPVNAPEFVNKKLLLPVLDEKDVMLHYPYQTFDHTVDILREAAIDPEVTKIYINLYRVARDSKVVNALVNASKNGKEVLAVVELRARFDEENNLHWSSELKQEGIEVLFGVPGLKVHSKLIYIEKKQGGKTKRYAHIGTGNFHEKTAKVYGDLTLWTSHKEIAKEVRQVFQFFRRNYILPQLSHLLMSPFNTRSSFLDLIAHEVSEARLGHRAEVFLKVNNLVDKELIDALYDAAEAGVKIKIVVRGICAMIPELVTKTGSIEIISIVGRFLEHVRAVRFYNGGKERYYISSADWMNRNLSNRIEISVPIYDSGLQQILDDYFTLQWKDSQKARIINVSQNNPYRFKERGKVNSQEALMDYFSSLGI